MGYRERRQKHKEEFRTEILQAALSLFSEEGYVNFSMRKLAARIDYSPTTIYLYFRDKDDLLFHICENFYTIVLHELEVIRINESSPEQSLEDYIRFYIRFGLSNPEQYKVVFFSNPVIYGSPEDFLSRETMSLRCWEKVHQLVGDCINSGFFRSIDCDTLSVVWWSAVHGLISNLIFTKDFPMPDADVLMTTLTEGLFKGYRR